MGEKAASSFVGADYSAICGVDPGWCTYITQGGGWWWCRDVVYWYIIIVCSKVIVDSFCKQSRVTTLWFGPHLIHSVYPCIFSIKYIYFFVANLNQWLPFFDVASTHDVLQCLYPRRNVYVIVIEINLLALGVNVKMLGYRKHCITWSFVQIKVCIHIKIWIILEINYFTKNFINCWCGE